MTTPQLELSITARELHHRLADGGAEMLDVRTPAEYAAAHVPGARLIPLAELDAAAFLNQRGAAGKPIYVICQSGARARRAVELFQRAGFDGCVPLEGGMEAWLEAGLPASQGGRQVMPLMRQVQLTVGVITAAGATLAVLVNPWFALVPLVIGCGLTVAGLTGTCGLALVLARMPWNQAPKCGTDRGCGK